MVSLVKEATRIVWFVLRDYLVGEYIDFDVVRRSDDFTGARNQPWMGFTSNPTQNLRGFV